MTKSFTAATILQLRDEGRLRLDDPVAAHVPAAGRAGVTPTADAGPITIRQLLTMSAGLPTDDPWGDRQQALPLDAFDGPAAGAAGDRLDARARRSTTRTSATGSWGASSRPSRARSTATSSARGCSDRSGLASTGFREDEVPAERLAHGYVRRERCARPRGPRRVRRPRLDGRPVLDGRGPRPVGRLVPRRGAVPGRAGGRHRAPARVATGDAAGAPRVRRRAGGAWCPPRPRGARRWLRLRPGGDVRPGRSGSTSSTAAGTRASGRYMAWHPASGLGIVAPREPALRLAPRLRRPPARGARRGGRRGPRRRVRPSARDRGVRGRS